ncbi:hypothetical protein EIKCOROL_01267 [Eikenella corrodens ATCC 23834]|uniref:Uncharacterized protein n=1 Tax=Eikenella corrodens ATCC 23834 TaxID=546274 RepID=C0DV78_EIKCO|nr:hypothetical protein EIKCOROL_01267 [Eikenella corrodens ATCC 23834]
MVSGSLQLLRRLPENIGLNVNQNHHLPIYPTHLPKPNHS